MASTNNGPPSQGWKDSAQSPSTSAEQPSSSSSQHQQQQPPTHIIPKATSPAPCRSFGLPELTRTESDRISLKSHVSLPVIGTLPLGSLHVHKAMDSPRPQQTEAAQIDEASDMPPLENDDKALAGSSSGSHAGGGGRRRNDGDDDDAFLILDLPRNSTVGCDAKAIGTGTSEFKGIRGIPPGPHFIWVSEPNAMSRSGYWFVTSTSGAHGKGGGRVRVKQWDRFNEVLVEPASQFEVRDLSENIASLYPQLVPHGYGSGDTAAAAAAATTKKSSSRGPIKMISPQESEPDIGGVGDVEVDEDSDSAQMMWRRLTSSVDEKLLARVTGQRGDGVAEWLVDTSDSARGEGTSFPHAAAQVYGAVAGAGELDFLFPEGDVDLAAMEHEHDQPAAAATIESPARKEEAGNDNDNGSGSGSGTIKTPDTTRSILRLLDHPGTGITGSDLVGELQFTFLTGLHLSNLSCVDQWWHLVLKVVLRAHDLTTLRPGLARALIRTLHAQMVYNERYIAGGGGGGTDTTTTTATTATTTTTTATTGKGRGEEDEYEGFEYAQQHQQQQQQQARHEYGGADAQGTSILDIVPGNKRRLREALALFRRGLDARLLLDVPPAAPGGQQQQQQQRITDEQGGVGRAFAGLEAWFWKFGWDLRVDAVRERERERMRVKCGGDGDDDDDDDDDDDAEGYLGRSDGGGGGDDDDDDDYQPVIVDLDENGREVGLVSFN